MQMRWIVMVVGVSLLGAAGLSQGQRHLNPVVDLLAAKKPVFGVYGPRNPRARPGAPATADTVKPKTPAELAKDALGYTSADYIFDGSMEGDFDRNYPVFAEFAKGMAEGGMITVNLDALTAEGQNLARVALDLWTDVIGVTFTQVSGDAQIVYSVAFDGLRI